MVTAEIDLDVDVAEELMHKYRNVRVSIERIGPSQAREYLSMNTKNRKLNAHHVTQLQAAMLAGEWWMNGETIIFGVDGTLLNGQHRLSAIIEAGVSVDVMVVSGIDEQAFRTLDGGRARTTGEVLAMDGEKNSNAVAAAVQALVSFVNASGDVLCGGSNFRKATPTLAAKVLEIHPHMRDSVSEMRRNKVFRNQHASLLPYLFWMVDKSKAGQFASVLADGHNDLGRPFVVLRESLVRTPLRPDLRRAYCAKAIKSFNAELAGERPKMLKFLSGEEFPTIAGLDYDALAESLS